jgi:hypothetical protein
MSVHLKIEKRRAGLLATISQRDDDGKVIGHPSVEPVASAAEAKQLAENAGAVAGTEGLRYRRQNEIRRSSGKTSTDDRQSGSSRCRSDRDGEGTCTVARARCWQVSLASGLGAQVRRKLVHGPAGRACGRAHNNVLVLTETSHYYKTAIAAEIVNIAVSPEQRPRAATRFAPLRLGRGIYDV